MHSAQNQRIAVIIPPQAIKDNGAFTTTSVDTEIAGLGKAHFVTIYVMFGATDIAPTVMRVQESDDDGSADTYATIAGLDFTGAFPGTDDDNKVWAFFIPMEGRDRYLDLNLTAGNGTSGTYATAWAVLEWLDEAPKSASDRGLDANKFPTVS